MKLKHFSNTELRCITCVQRTDGGGGGGAQCIGDTISALGVYHQCIGGYYHQCIGGYHDLCDTYFFVVVSLQVTQNFL